MNSFNAVGFLALGSLMNAVPALMPSVVARGPLLGDMSTSAVWLHLMGFLVGMIGSAWIVREVFAYHVALTTALARRQVAAQENAAPQISFDSDNAAVAQAA